jgi:hypothetical protein
MRFLRAVEEQAKTWDDVAELQETARRAQLFGGIGSLLGGGGGGACVHVCVRCAITKDLLFPMWMHNLPLSESAWLGDCCGNHLRRPLEYR